MSRARSKIQPLCVANRKITNKAEGLRLDLITFDLREQAECGGDAGLISDVEMNFINQV